MNLVGHAGTMTSNQMATIRNCDTKDPVWYHPEYITNILSILRSKINIELHMIVKKVEPL